MPGAGFQIRVREYTDDAERLSEDLRRSSLVLMPSRAEGFGLVGLEAIAAGVPVLVSDRSGLGELLVERLGAPAAASFVVRTSLATANFETDAGEWAQAIEEVLRHRSDAFARAGKLLAELADQLTWEAAVTARPAAVPRPA